ncbi:MAG TPA: ATP synthase F1 subunit delta [Candidatus Hydrogenedentes bacterium]|nr:ATP synthase F1 subunit delta [Candidatus Hydrogenedentota bacterium]
MIRRRIAERYAKGLLAAIGEVARLDEAAAALSSLAALFDAEHDLRSILANPVLDIRAQARVLDEVLAQGGLPEAVGRLAHVLLRRGRITLLPEVARVFADLTDDALGRARASVVTAKPLDEAQRAQIEESLATFSGKTVRMTCEEDADLIGGAVARIDGFVIDGSVRAQLERMKKALLAEET